MHIKSENTAAQYRATVPVNADMLLLYYDMSLILFLSGKICLNETLSRHWFGCHKASSGVWNRNVYDQLQRTSKREYVIEPTKTNAGTRVIPMTNEVTEMFRAIIEDRPDYKVEKVIDGYTGFLFLDKDGMPLVAMHWEHRFNHMVSRYNEIYKVQMPNITPHVCRHTYCSNMAKSGMNPKTLQYLMGHSDIAVTLNVYTHVGLEDAEKELQKMQGLENARKEMGISDTDDKPLKQNMFKVV